MQASKHRSWRISIHARARNFNFKFRAWQIKGTHFSVLVKIHHFFLKMVTETGNSIETRQRASSKSRILWIFNKLRLRKAANKASAGKEISFTPKKSDILPYEDPMAAITGNLSLLSKSVALRNYGGIFIHAFTIFFYLISLFKNFLTRRSYFLVASMVSSIGFSLSYLNYQGLISDTIWKAWNHVVSFGCLYLLTQVIFSKFSLFIERNKLVGFLISAILPLSQLISGRRGHVDEAPAWTANLLLACQTFFDVLGNPKDPKTLAFFISSTHCLLKDLACILAPYLRV